MSLAEWLAIIGIAVAAIAIGIGVFNAQRWGTRRLKLAITTEATPLLPALDGPGRQLLEVTFRNFPVDDPHLLRIRLSNIGRGDIASERFDAGREIRLESEVKFYGAISAQGFVSPSIGSDCTLFVRPRLIKRGETLEMLAIASGNANFRLDCPLVDVAIVRQLPSEMLVTVSRSVLREVISAILPVRL